MTTRFPRAFRDSEAFRAWLERNGASESELVVRCYRTAHARRGITYHQALDEALCFGWIDGVRHGVDEVSFTVRFTPRKPGSSWSQVNVRRATELRANGRMRPPGIGAFERRTAPSYSYESRPKSLPAPFLRRLRADPEAWLFFHAQPPWYRRTSAFWVLSAKRPETRERRFDLLLSSSRAGTRIPALGGGSAREERVKKEEAPHGAQRV